MGGKLLSRLTRVAYAAYGLAAMLAAMALWGWALDVPWLRDLGADFAPMSPSAALAFILLAAGFLAAERGSRRSAIAACALSRDDRAARRSPTRCSACRSTWGSRRRRA